MAVNDGAIHDGPILGLTSDHGNGVGGAPIADLGAMGQDGTPAHTVDAIPEDANGTLALATCGTTEGNGLGATVIGGGAPSTTVASPTATRGSAHAARPTTAAARWTAPSSAAVRPPSPARRRRRDA